MDSDASNPSKRPNPIQEKSYAFALKCISFYKKLEQKKEYVLGKQLLKSGTSIGANVEEGVYAQSKKDFISKFSIALKETQETMYWLRLLRDSKIMQATEITPLLKDAHEIAKILTSILKTSKND